MRSSDEGFVVVFAAIGVTDREAAFVRRRFADGARARALRRLHQPRRRARGRAAHLPARRADRGRVPRLRARPPRARRARRHDQLLRGAARVRRRAGRGAGPARLPRLHVLRPRLALRTRGTHPRAAGLGDADPDPLDARRRRHAPDPRRDGLHHRGPDRPLPRARPARDRPADRRAALAQPADERRHRRGEHTRATTAASPTSSPRCSAAAASCAASISIVGEQALSDDDRRTLAFVDDFERQFVGQGEQRRSIEETLDLAWELLARFPADELKRIPTRARRAVPQRRAGAVTRGAHATALVGEQQRATVTSTAEGAAAWLNVS